MNESLARIHRSHKNRTMIPNIKAMSVAAIKEVERIKSELASVDEIESFNGIDIDRLASILGDMIALSSSAGTTPIMRSEEYRAIVDSTAIVSKADPKGKITYANGLFCNVSGYSLDELMGNSHNIMRHPDMPTDFFRDLWRTIAHEKKIWRGEIKNLSKEGREYWVDAIIIPQVDVDGEILGYIAFRYDVTQSVHQRMIAEQEQQLNQIILDGQASMVMVATKEKGIVKANRAFFKTFNFKSIEDFKLKHKCICELFIEHDGSCDSNDTSIWFEKILNTQDYNQHKVKILDKYRNIKTYSVVVKTVKDNIIGKRNKYYVLSLNDITEAQEEADSARMESYAKSSFLATMSHEIRTPMNGIMGFIGLLADTRLNEQQNEYVDIIKKSTESLMGIINDILDFSKIEAGSFEIEEIDFELIQEIENAVELFVAKATEKNINLCVFVDPELPSWAMGDPSRIKQILANLIGNAVKFTDENGEVSVIAEMAGIKNGKIQIEVSVSDTGSGMSEDIQKIIFSPFTQADNTISRKFGGTGLGLTICQNLANLMGSEIKFKSEQGLGSKFWFTLEVKTCNSIEDDKLKVDTEKTIAVYVAEEKQGRCAHMLERYLTAFNFPHIVIDTAEDSAFSSCDILVVVTSGKDQINSIDDEYMRTHRVVSIIPSGVMNRNRFSSHTNITMPINGSKIFDAIIDGRQKTRVLSPEDGAESKQHYWLFLNKQGKSPMVLRNSLISDF